jgi:hypothetical protein
MFLKFFDKLEDRIRGGLSRRPIIYAIIAGIGIVLFWRGVWDLSVEIGIPSVWAFIVGVVLLLATGTFVSFFIGDKIIISGMKAEKRIDEKTEAEIRTEEIELSHIDQDLKDLKAEVDQIRDRQEKN